jgi:hypothetical protein
MLQGLPDLAQLISGGQVYFSQFRKTPFGMLRLDPQDAGPGYRNVIGIPGGVDSPLFRVLQVGCLYSVRTSEEKFIDESFASGWGLDRTWPRLAPSSRVNCLKMGPWVLSPFLDV